MGDCVAKGITPLIDDFVDSDNRISTAENRLGFWYSYGDKTVKFTAPAVSAAGAISWTGGVAHAVGTGATRAASQGVAGLGFDFMAGEKAICAAGYNACAFDGLKVTLSGSAVRLKVSTPPTAETDDFGIKLAPGTTTITWDMLTQQGWGAKKAFSCSEIYKIQIQAVDPTKFDFTLDDLSFVTAGGGGGGTPSGLYGYFPAGVTSAIAKSAYDSWKTQLLESCGGGQLRVRWDTANLTVSEGIAYGMILAATWQDRATFDGFWAYAQAHKDPVGLMDWKVNGCGTTAGDGHGSAADADLDMAMALVMADCAWSGQGYGASATTLINLIQARLFVPDTTRHMVIAGDSWGNEQCVNPSYLSPAYYRAFAQQVPAQATFWNAAANDTYYYLDLADNATTGLVGDWLTVVGHTCSKGTSDYYGYDAARTPWRVGLDYLWWNQSLAKDYASRTSNFANGKGIANIKDGYYVDGAQVGGFHNAVFTGAFAVASMANAQSMANGFGQHVAGMTGGEVTGYFNASLSALYLATMSGQLTPGCF